MFVFLLYTVTSMGSQFITQAIKHWETVFIGVMAQLF